METKKKAVVAAGVVALLLVVAAVVLYSKVVSDVPDKDAATSWKLFEDARGLRFCEVFLIGGNALTKDLKASAYNSTGLNYGQDPRDSCPAELVGRLDLEADKKAFKVLSVYLNKPRFWTFDTMRVPVGPIREFNGLQGYFMGLGIIPKDADVKKPGWLTYRKSPVEKKTETELGYSRRLGHWVLDGCAAAWFFTTNHDHFSRNAYVQGTHFLSEEPIAAFQAHLSYDVRPRLWVSLDANFWYGGQLSVDGVEEPGSLQQSSRIGLSASFPLNGHLSMKVSYADGAYVRFGGDYRIVSAALLWAWIDRPK